MTRSPSAALDAGRLPGSLAQATASATMFAK
jgi:hypothetical protein